LIDLSKPDHDPHRGGKHGNEVAGNFVQYIQGGWGSYFNRALISCSIDPPRELSKPDQDPHRGGEHGDEGAGEVPRQRHNGRGVQTLMYNKVMGLS
jgi:hypothetical protein